MVRAAIDDTVAYAERALAAGVARESIVIDPAHDFGKNTFHSLELTRRLGEMVDTGWPVLVSLSNKDFVGETLDLPVGERLTGTLAATAVCALAGARIYRVHQVVETRQTVDMVSTIAGPPAAAARDPGAAVTRVVLVPGVLALLPEYAGIEDPVAELRAACLSAVGLAGPRGHGAGHRAGRPGRGVPPGRRPTTTTTGRRTSWSATVRRSGPRRRPATSTSAPRPSTPRWASRCAPASPPSTWRWPGSCGRTSTRSWSSATWTSDLGTAQVDYDDAPYGVQYWVMRWTS